MRRKKLFLSFDILTVIGAVGFQLVDQKLYMLHSEEAIEDYEEIDYGLGSNYLDSLRQYPDLKMVK